MLYNWISQLRGVSNATLEAWIPETHQRPDIMFWKVVDFCYLDFGRIPYYRNSQKTRKKVVAGYDERTFYRTCESKKYVAASDIGGIITEFVNNHQL